MSVQKIMKDVLTEIKLEAEKTTSFGGSLGAKLVDQLSKQLTGEMKINPDFEARLAEIILPDVIPNPVAILQKSGKQELERRLKKLTAGNIKIVAQKNKLAGLPDFKRSGKNLNKTELIKMLIEKTKKEAGYSAGI